jgi:hypothetical protein
LYLNQDAQNVLWEFGFRREGLILTSSSDEGSNAAKSFIICPPGTPTTICDPQDPFKVQLVADLKKGDTITWKVEALKGSDAVNDLAGAGYVFSNKPYAYGETKLWKTGRYEANTEAVGINANKGRYEETWERKPQEAISTAFFSFMPDMSGEIGKHLPTIYRNATCGKQYSQCMKGTNGSDNLNHNPHVAYKITAILNDEPPFTVTVKMDHKDVLRQEYINHLRSAADALGKNVYVPEREEIVAKSGNWVTSDYPYSVFFFSGLLAPMWDGVNDNFVTYRTNAFAGFNNTTFTVPDNTIKVNSAYRNPERNERVGGASGSWHMRSRALDVGFDDLLYPKDDVAVDQRGKVFGPLWRMMTDNNAVPSASMFQLEGRAGPKDVKLRSTGSDGHSKEPSIDEDEDEDEDGIPDEYELSYHLHIQDAT